MQIFNKPNPWAGLGESLATGLSQLADTKLSDIQQRHNQQSLSKLFKQGGHDENTSNILATLANKHPASLPKILELLGGGMSPERTPAEEIQPGQEQKIQQKPRNFAEAISSGAQRKQAGKAGRSAAELKHEDEILLHAQNTQKIISTAERMLKRLDKGIEVGLKSDILSRTVPTWLDENTEGFDTDAGTILTLASQEIPGLKSVYRVKALEKTKPGVNHSVKVNKEILKKTLRESKAIQNALFKDYPQLKSKVSEIKNEDQQDEYELAQEDPLKYPQYYQEGTQIEVNGTIHTLTNGQWDPPV